MRQEQEIQIFGTTIADMTEEAEEMGGITLEYIASLLSDTQEELARGRTEKVRQMLNVAKYFLSRSR